MIDARFFFVRHGETDWNREGRLQGQRDVPLNARGQDQAMAVGRSLKRLTGERNLDPRTLDYVSSPLSRTRGTMELLRLALGLEPHRYRLEDRLRELGFGTWEGRTWAEIAATDPFSVKARKRDKWGTVSPGGESYAQLVERIRPWLETVTPDSIVVAHGGVARAILTLTTDLDPASAVGTLIPQGRVMVVGQGRATWH